MNLRVAELSDFPTGWIIGDFEPAFVTHTGFEIALKTFIAGEKEPEHFQKKATEITIVISGSCRLGDVHLSAGQIVEVPVGVSASFEALTDSTLVVLKTPSVPGDKIVGEGELSLG